MALPAEWTADEQVAALPPGTSVVSTSTPEGRRLRRTINRGIAHLIVRYLARAARHGRRRSSAEVMELYDRSHTGGSAAMAESYAAERRKLLYRIADKYVCIVHPPFVTSMMTWRLKDIIEALAPSSVCEVGCGDGRNLLCLGAHVPGISFTGYELTAGGVAIARGYQELDLPATAYGKLYRITSENQAGARRVRFEQGSAFSLPAPDKSFDLVYTSAALEQMQDGLPKALAELRRISRRYVLLYEPFGDCNDVLGRLYLWARDYFRMQSNDLTRFGLRPIARWYAIPTKPTFAFGFVLCEIV